MFIHQMFSTRLMLSGVDFQPFPQKSRQSGMKSHRQSSRLAVSFDAQAFGCRNMTAEVGETAMPAGAWLTALTLHLVAKV